MSSISSNNPLDPSLAAYTTPALTTTPVPTSTQTASTSGDNDVDVQDELLKEQILNDDLTEQNIKDNAQKNLGVNSDAPSPIQLSQASASGQTNTDTGSQSNESAKLRRLGRHHNHLKI